MIAGALSSWLWCGTNHLHCPFEWPLPNPQSIVCLLKAKPELILVRSCCWGHGDWGVTKLYGTALYLLCRAHFSVDVQRKRHVVGRSLSFPSEAGVVQKILPSRSGRVARGQWFYDVGTPSELLFWGGFTNTLWTVLLIKCQNSLSNEVDMDYAI